MEAEAAGSQQDFSQSVNGVFLEDSGYWTQNLEAGLGCEAACQTSSDLFDTNSDPENYQYLQPLRPPQPPQYPYFTVDEDLLEQEVDR